jgi:hypothetical protein
MMAQHDEADFLVGLAVSDPAQTFDFAAGQDAFA